MDGRGGCCMVRYAGDAAVASQVERIMLRFRPIAPKPPSPRAGSPSSGSPGGNSAEPAARGEVGRRRGRRDGGGRRGRNRRAHPDERVTKKRVTPPEDPVTLQLLPETPERKEPAAAAVAPAGCPQLPDLAPSHLPPCAVTDARRVAAAAGRRCTWAEARIALEGDACPALLSDASDRVAWTNAAYRRMVGSSSGEAVELATGGGFSCRLRVGEKGCLTVPCDVWRLAEDGWLAWRLDVTAALSLGR